MSRGRRWVQRLRLVVSNPWFKAVATLVILGLIIYWLRGQMPFFARGFELIGELNWWWATLALVFSFLSMSSYGSVQKLLLGSAGVKIGYWDSLGLIFASNAISMSIPGGQVFGATLTYKRTRQWGATRVIASWQLVISGILATAGIVILALYGFFLVGRGSNPVLLALSGTALIGALFVIQWAARHPDRIEGVLLQILAWFNRRRRKPEDAGAGRVHAVIEQAEVVDLSRWQLTRAFGWSLLNWVADIGCLWAASMAVDAQHSFGGLAIAYVTGKIVASAPVTPGGLGTVEFALITALTAGGLGADVAFASVFIYRIVSFLLVALAGWLIFAIFYRDVVNIEPPEDEPVDGTGTKTYDDPGSSPPNDSGAEQTERPERESPESPEHPESPDSPEHPESAEHPGSAEFPEWLWSRSRWGGAR